MGTVTIMQLSTCVRLGVLNQGICELPRELREIPVIDDDVYPKPALNKM